MDQMLVVTPQRCTGCRSCELACAFVHGSMSRPGAPRVKVCPTAEEQYVPILCLQCSDAACVKICPVGALNRNEDTGAIELDEARCVRCKLCVVACPFGNLGIDPSSGKMIKCDLCEGDPVCARFCPSGTLLFLPFEEAGARTSSSQVLAAATGS